MDAIILIILIGLAGGVAVGLQGPLASMISQRLGIFESVFIVHLGGGPALKGFNCLTTRSGCLSNNDLLILPHLLVYSVPES